MTYTTQKLEQAMVAVRTLQFLIAEGIWKATDSQGLGLASIQHERNNKVYYSEHEWLNTLNQNSDPKPAKMALAKLEKDRVHTPAAPTMTLAFNYMKKQMPQYLPDTKSNMPTIEKLKGPEK